MIAILDYGAGNLKSVEKAFQHLGYEAVITSDGELIKQCSGIILPGVGAYGDAMHSLRKSNLIPTIKQCIESGTPFLGICLGMQLLFESSEETPGIDGLSFMKGRIVRIPHKKELKIPHVGWNSLSIKQGSRLFEGIKDGAYVYFVHSYYLQANENQIVAATTHYSEELQIAIEYKNVFATQFHPEKSGDVGLMILNNFAKMTIGRY